MIRAPRFLALLVVIVAALFSTGGKSPPQIALRVHVQIPEKGLSKQSFPVLIPDPLEQINVAAFPEASEQNLLEVVPRLSTHGYGAFLRFNHQALVNLNAATSQNQGRMIVVIVNTHVVYSPMIDSVISNGTLFIPDGITQKEMEALVKKAEANRKEAKS